MKKSGFFCFRHNMGTLFLIGQKQHKGGTGYSEEGNLKGKRIVCCYRYLSGSSRGSSKKCISENKPDVSGPYRN